MYRWIHSSLLLLIYYNIIYWMKRWESLQVYKVLKQRTRKDSKITHPPIWITYDCALLMTVICNESKRPFLACCISSCCCILYEECNRNQPARHYKISRVVCRSCGRGREMLKYQIAGSGQWPLPVATHRRRILWENINRFSWILKYCKNIDLDGIFSYIYVLCILCMLMALAMATTLLKCPV